MLLMLPVDQTVTVTEKTLGPTLVSFCDWKRRLLGDLHAYGRDAVCSYTERKTITQRCPSTGVREGTMLSFPSSK